MNSSPQKFGSLAEAQIKAMFDRIAGCYDVMNAVMTAGLHQRWRERAADLAQVKEGNRVLDVATGTGDLAIALSHRVGPSGAVIGCDFSEKMLQRARDKAPTLSWECANALALPYPDNHFDGATVGFGLRNFADYEAGLKELQRVVRPGGRVVVLEITTPTTGPVGSFFSLWFDRIVPLLGRAVGDRDAYRYLPQSVKRFPPPPQLAEIFSRVGMCEISWVLTAGGIIAIHAGTVAVTVAEREGTERAVQVTS